ncbi:MAG TPA: hypothetical protein ENJ33_02295 [Thiothrix sp.]|nr:hypothetical protein [Thiothrix sp.]
MNRFFPFQATMFCSLFFLSIDVFSDTSKTLYTGLTYTNNLEVQADTDIQGNQSSLTREGIVTGLSFIKQSLDYTGGYTFQADASFNKGFTSDTDISRFVLSASTLSALNPDWLWRNTISLNHYDNEALTSNSYKGLLLGTTFGYLNNVGGGSDISFSLKQEKHDQVDVNNEAYDTTRSNLTFIHYFPHKKDAPYWNFNTALKSNNASDKQRKYDSTMLGINYKQWTLASFDGQIGINWQQDRYDQTAFALPNQMGGMNATGKKRKDTLYVVSLQLGKTLTPSIALQFSAGFGEYDSTSSADAERFYRFSTHLTWRF